MKKYTLLIIVGVFFLMCGIVLFMTKKENITIYNGPNILQESEANQLIVEKIKAIIEVYEKQIDTFNTVTESEEESNYLEVQNYEEVVSKLFSDNGIKELENTKFNGNSFIKKEEDKIFILSKIPNNNLYSNCSISVNNIIIKETNVKATVSLVKSSIDQNNALVYNIYEKDIELIKKDDKWFVNSFIYTNI